MKLSDAMEAGFAKVGKQCFGVLYTGAHYKPEKVCAVGAAYYGQSNCAFYGEFEPEPNAAQVDYVVRLNNQCRMPIPEIVEVLRGMGL